MNQPSSIPLNIPDLSKLAQPTEVALGIHWPNGEQAKFEMEDIQQMSEPDFRLFIMCVLAGNPNDPRFVERFMPKADEDPVDDSDAVPAPE